MRHLFAAGRVRAVLIAACALGFTGCAALNLVQPHSHIKGKIPKRDTEFDDGGSDAFRVGAARVELTPIPGIAMNYSIDGRVSRGFWTRLYARAIYLQDARIPKKHAIVLVSCDLPHIPNGLGDEVAKLVRKRVPHLAREQIVLAATHTHQGPENFFSAEIYNAVVSPRAGFDEQLFAFLAERIATAIERAFEARRDAKLRFRQAKLDGFFRNRSFGAFLRNGDSADLLAENAPAISLDCPRADPEDPREVCRAVRAVVEVLEFVGTGADPQPIATAAFLAAHPTVLDTETEVFSGDLFGVTSLLLEQRRLTGECSAYAPGVVALFNGAQGDVSATWQERNRFELLNSNATKGRIGLAVRLAKFICGNGTGIDPDGDPEDALGTEIEFRLKWLTLKSRRPRDASDPPDTSKIVECDPWDERCTAEKPRPGASTLGGAQDGRSLWYEFGLREGLRSAARGEHGRKWLTLEMDGVPIEISDMLAKPGRLPKRVPVGIYRIGSIVIAALPGEFTTMMGERIRSALAEAAVTAGDDPASPAKAHVLLIGLANGHVSYVSTPEEYDAQFYEGGNNFYGAATGPLIQKRLEALTKASNPKESSDPEKPKRSSKPKKRKYEYDPGKCRVFHPGDAGAPSYRADDGLQKILMDLEQPAATKRDFPQMCWVDAIPKLSRIPDGGCVRSVPYVWIEKTNTANPGDQCKQMFASASQTFLARPCDAPRKDACTASDPRLCVAGVPQDNCGLDLVTVLHGSYADRTRWCAFWMPPEGTELAQDYSICVAGVTNENIVEKGGAYDPSLPEKRPAMPPLDRASEYNWLQQLFVNHMECCGHPTRTVCEWPPLPTAAGP